MLFLAILCSVTTGLQADWLPFKDSAQKEALKYLNDAKVAGIENSWIHHIK